MKKIFKILAYTNFIFSGIWFAGYLVLFPIDSLFSSRVTETKNVLGYTYRPSNQGAMQTIIVGEKFNDDKEVMVFCEVKFEDYKKYPLGSQVTYNVGQTFIRQERGWGQIEK